jgi:hypothetical protein
MMTEKQAIDWFCITICGKENYKNAFYENREGCKACRDKNNFIKTGKELDIIEKSALEEYEEKKEKLRNVLLKHEVSFYDIEETIRDFVKSTEKAIKELQDEKKY